MEHMDKNEELYRAWIGEKNQDVYFEKMHKGGFNWVAFLLRDLLLITRKMFAESIIFLLLAYFINTILSIMRVPDIICSGINLVFCLILGFTYYYLYRWHIKRKIVKYQKKGLSYEEQLEKAKKYGGDKITMGVILMFIIEIVLVLFLTVGVDMILDIISSAKDAVNNNTGYETNDNNFNYDSSNSNLNDSYYSNTDDLNNNYCSNTNTLNDDYYSNSNDLGDNKKSWYLDSFSLSYNENDWQEVTQEGHQALKYKDTENYLAYIGSGDNVGLDTIKSQNFQETFEQQMQQQMASSNPDLTYVYSNWENVNDKLYLCTIKCSVSDPNIGAYGYITYYYYFSDSKMYALMTEELQSDYSFEYDVKEVLDTIE